MTLFWPKSSYFRSLNWIKGWEFVGCWTFSEKNFDWQLLYNHVSTQIFISLSRTHTDTHTHILWLWDQSAKDRCSGVRQDTGRGQAGPISSVRVQIPSATQTDCVPEKLNSLGQRASPPEMRLCLITKKLPGHQAYCHHTRRMKLTLHQECLLRL